MPSPSDCLNLRHLLLRAFKQFLHLFDINLYRRIIPMPHHPLHPCRIRVIEQGKGGS